MENFQPTQRYWYVLYTRPRFEKKVDSILKQKGVHSFLPLCNVVRHWSNGKKLIQEPLFHSYVFVHVNLKEQDDALKTYGVTRYVTFNDKPACIPEEQIASIFQILKFGYVPERFAYLEIGDKIEIVSGPLRGLTGFYVEERGSGKLVISLDFIRQSFSVIVDRRQIRPIYVS